MNQLELSFTCAPSQTAESCHKYTGQVSTFDLTQETLSNELETQTENYAVNTRRDKAVKPDALPHYKSARAAKIANCHSLVHLRDLKQDAMQFAGASNNLDQILAQDLNLLSLIRAAHFCLKSAVVQTLYDSAMQDNWRITIADLEGQDYHLDVPERTLSLNSHGLGARSLYQSHYFSNVICLSLIRALRDMWQEKHHDAFEAHYQPQDIIVLERIRTADCESVLTLALWQIERAGHAALWRHFVGSSEGDIALSFAHYIGAHQYDTDFHLHHAMQIVFTQWFAASERITQCDHDTLEYLDNLLQDGAPHLFGDSAADHALIEALTTLPKQASYLSHISNDVLSDSYYTSLCDPINKSHLDHIMRDLNSVEIAGVAFSNPDLAAKIFPDQI